MMGSTASTSKVKLGDYLTVLTDYHANGSYEKLRENVQLLDTPDYAVMIRTTNFEKDDFEKDLKYIDKQAYTFLEKSRVEPGDILMNKIADPGTVYRMPELNRPVSLAMNLFLLRTDSTRLDQAFAYFWLKANEAYVKSFACGAATATITKKAVRDLEISLPPLPIQQRIAHILLNYCEFIENCQKRVQILEKIGQMIYREWFVNFRFPGYESHPQFTSSIGEIPQSWDVSSVRELAGLVSRGPTISYVGEGGIPVLNQRCIRNGEIDLQAVQFAEPLSTKKSHLYLRPFDVLINSMGVGTLGRVSRNLSITEPMIIHNCITVVRPKMNEPTAEFLYYRLSECQAHFERLGVGATGQTSLRSEVIENVRFALPPMNLLERFSSIVQPIWIQIGNLKREIENLRRTRDLLLPRLLSGQINLEVA